MDPKLLQLIEEAVNKGITSQSWLLMLILVVVAGLTAFLAAYLKKLGEQRAQNKNFEELLQQIDRKTSAIENIKGDIAKDIKKLESTLAEDVQFKTEILLPRINAYKTLWAMTYVVRPTQEEPITDAEKAQLIEDMTAWYYTIGNGIFLSLEAGKLWRQARRSLSSGEDKAIKKIFGTLRTQIKIDIRVYGLKEAEKEIGT